MNILISFLLVMSVCWAGVSDAISEAQFNAMFPNRGTGSCASDGANTTYTYSNFVSAAAIFPDFANTGSLEDQKREVAAFLGQTSHETTGGGGSWCGGVTDQNSGCFDWGYCYTEEVSCDDGTCTQYSDNGNSVYPVVSGHSYHGRGAIQLSWNYNYGPAGEQMAGDKMYLLNNPDLVKTSDWAFKTAIWYWMDATSSRPSPHAIILGTATGDSRGNTYGGVTNSINGGLECGSVNSGKIDKQHDRVNFFKNYANDLGVSAKPSSFTGTDESYFYCTSQNNFGSNPWSGQDIPTTIVIEGSSSSTTSSSSVTSSSIAVSSSSASTGGTCQRNLVSGYNFNLANASTAISGHQQNNYNTQGGPFSQGDVVVPQGMDCSLGLTLATAADSWNLYSTSNWSGSNQTGVLLEKVTWVASSSSSNSSSSLLSSSAVLSSSSVASGGVTCNEGSASTITYTVDGDNTISKSNGGGDSRNDFSVNDSLKVQGDACSCYRVITGINKSTITLNSAYDCSTGSNQVLVKVTNVQIGISSSLATSSSSIALSSSVSLSSSAALSSSVSLSSSAALSSSVSLSSSATLSSSVSLSSSVALSSSVSLSSSAALSSSVSLSNSALSSSFSSSSSAVSDCVSWTGDLCPWDGASYACISDKVTDDGVAAYSCVAGLEPFCNGYSPSQNSWNQWSPNGSCTVQSSSSQNVAPIMRDSSLSVSEDVSLSTTILDLDLLVQDDGSSLQYSLLTNGASFAIASTSMIQVAATLDFESNQNYLIEIEVSDGSLLDTATLSVNVVDVFEEGIIATSIPLTQNIILQQGWNLISFNVVPDQTSAANVFQAGDKVLVVKNVNGDSYIPSQAIDNLSPISAEQGYKVYASALDTITVSGFAIDTQYSNKIFAAGWSYIPFWAEQNKSIVLGSMALQSSLSILKDQNGKSYLPDYSINDIDSLEAGQGYLILLQSADTLDFKN